MRLRLAVCVLATGCSFQPGVLRSDAGTADDDAGDAAGDAPVDAFIGTWSHRKPITIHASRIRGGPHDDFPVMIARFVDAELAATARDDGFDIRFATSDGTVLPYERSAFDGSNGRFRGWVRVPSISNVGDTTIFMYYGNPDAPDQQQRAATWSASFAAVWHLDGNGDDATSNNNTATATNGALHDVTGAVGPGVEFDGVNDLLVMANSASLDAVATAGTLSGWINYTDATSNDPQFVMASSNNHTMPKSSFEWATGTNGNHFFYPRRGDGDNAYNMVDDPFTDGTWHHIAVTLDFATKGVDIYVDGNARALSVANVDTMWTNVADPADWYWGGHTMYEAPFQGRMDELRAASVVRTPGWISTEYSNQSDPDAFFTVGAEQAL